MTQWEHDWMYVPAEPGRLKDIPKNNLVGMGLDGWELVSSMNVTKEGTTVGVLFIFKRPIEE